jgi:hypothetical protein
MFRATIRPSSGAQDCGYPYSICYIVLLLKMKRAGRVVELQRGTVFAMKAVAFTRLWLSLQHMVHCSIVEDEESWKGSWAATWHCVFAMNNLLVSRLGVVMCERRCVTYCKPRTQDCVTQPQYHLLFGNSTHDARAVITVNKGPMQRKHTNWSGWTAGRRVQ